MPNVKGSVQQRGWERRRQIVSVAMDLFARNGTRGTGIAAIATAAGIATSTLLHHFGSKAGLLRAVLEERDRIEYEKFDKLMRSDTVTMQMLPEVAQHWVEHRAIARLHTVLCIENLDDDAPMHDYFKPRQRLLVQVAQQAIEAAQERGEVPTDLDARLKAIEIVAVQEGLHLMWQLDPDEIPVVEAMVEYCEATIRSLRISPDTSDGGE